MEPSTTPSLIVAGAAALLFLLSAVQSLLTRGIGSDHPVHRFLVRAVRRNGNRFFDRIPGILNETRCGALPLYLHWALSWLGSRGMGVAEVLLNPLTSAVHAVVVGCIAGLGPEGSAQAGFVALAFALTPQGFHAFSARNFGLSARSPGLLFVTLFLLSARLAAVHGGYAWVALCLSAWLVWAFSTFAAQAMLIISVLLVPIAGDAVPLVGAALGLAVFVALHPRYSLAYLVSTWRFVLTYSREIAPIYVLARRRSIWRDLVWDGWLRLRIGPGAAVRYAYDNSVLIVLFLNPLIPLGCAAFFRGGMRTGTLEGFAGGVSTAALLAVLITSFRPTRFLGEPERYAEAAAPWGAIAGVPMVIGDFGMTGLVALLAAFLLVDSGQILMSFLVARHSRGRIADHAALAASIAGLGPGIRCCCNNEQVTKALMDHDWEFACCISAGDSYCGMAFTEAFDVYPHLRRGSMQRIVREARVNVCILERTVFDSLFDVPPDGLVGSRLVHESPAFRVLLLEWAPPVHSAVAS
jgi:hypothetical protein